MPCSWRRRAPQFALRRARCLPHAGGQAQNIIGKVFGLLPGVESVAFAAGLTVSKSGEMTVVDTDKKWILVAQDAAAYVQTNPSLLSLLINVSQGGPLVDFGGGPITPEAAERRQRQTFLDAEWRQFLSGTLAGMTSLVRSWPMDSIVLAVHAKHASPLSFPFPFWNAQNGPDLTKMVAAIYAQDSGAASNICTGKYSQYH